MDAAERRRLEALAEKYITSLLTAANANEQLGENRLARARYLELQELPLPNDVAEKVSARLACPAIMAAGLAFISRSPRTGCTAWVFEDASNEAGDENFEPMPTQGVQSDSRSICPLVRTPQDHLDAALDLAGASANDMVADLGCGDGRMLLKAASRGCTAVGFDVNPYCLRRCAVAAERAGVSDRVEVVDHDFLTLAGHPRFRSATVVFAYLIPRVIAKLEPLLCGAAAAGKRVVIYCPTGSSSTPGNALGALRPVAVALGGKLRMYGARGGHHDAAPQSGAT